MALQCDEAIVRELLHEAFEKGFSNGWDASQGAAEPLTISAFNAWIEKKMPLLKKPM